jgi:hypothetical protein
VSENSNTESSAEADQPQEPPSDQQELDDYVRMMLDSDDQTPEEAGYGHGV